MAIYHFSISVISRARGERMVAAAACHAAAVLRDEYYGITHNHSRRPGIEFNTILAPAGAPEWVYDRESLWNRVEAAEQRKDAQLARAVSLSLPSELSIAQNIELLREFAAAQFVARGMIADLSIRRDRLGHPTAHMLLSLRELAPTGFGMKARDWNRKSNLLDWRCAWASRANFHLARAGHRVRIDHRTLEAQQVELIASRRVGNGSLVESDTAPAYLQERVAEQRAIAHTNGTAILQDPSLAVRALARQRSIFTAAELASFLASRTDGAIQAGAALAAVMACGELSALPHEEGQPQRFTSRDLIEAERSLLRRAATLAARGVSARAPCADLPAAQTAIAPFEASAAAYLLGPGDLKILALPADSASRSLEAARAQWERAQRPVSVGNPLSAALPAKGEVLIVESAELLELKQLEKLLAVAESARSTLVLLADPEQLGAMGDISALHGLLPMAFGAR